MNETFKRYLPGLTGMEKFPSKSVTFPLIIVLSFGDNICTVACMTGDLSPPSRTVPETTPLLRPLCAKAVSPHKDISSIPKTHFSFFCSILI